MNRGYYKLDGQVPVPCDDLMEWAKSFEGTDRRVALDMVEGVKISTVFLGLDHSFGDGPPLLFETMVFGGTYDNEQERYSTWEQAVSEHNKWTERVADDG